MPDYLDRWKIQRAYKAFIEKDFSNETPEATYNLFRNALGPYPETIWEVNSSVAFVRARTVDEQKEDITLPTTFGAPPSKYTKVGRANMRGAPVFYSSFDSRVAMHEIKVPLDTVCYVSIWENIGELPKLATYINAVHAKNDFSDLSKRLPLNRPKNLEKVYSKGSFKMAMTKRSKLFREENYNLSSRIAHQAIFLGNPDVSGILYPSVIDKYRCNVALNPKFVIQNYRPIRLYKMVWSGAFIFRVLARGTLRNDKIIWEETGTYELDSLDNKYSGSRGPKEIDKKALKVLYNK